MDPVSIDFDRLFENVSTESKELLNAALNETCPSFVKLLQDLTKQVDTSQNFTSSVNELNSSILSYGCCPPPKSVACVAFNDAVIKVLGDRGGFDEYFHQQYKAHCRPRSSCKARSNQNAESHTETLHINSNTLKNSRDMMETEEYYEMKHESGNTPREGTATTCTTATGSYIQNSKDTYTYEWLSRLVLENWASIVSIGRARNSPHSNSTTGSSGSGGTDAVSSAQLPTRCSPIPLPAPGNLTSAAIEQLIQFYPSSSSSSRSPSTNSSNNGKNNSSSSSGGSGSNNCSNTIAQPLPAAVLLGKRGRYFLDIWEEEEFLQRNKLKTEFRTLHSWSDLFHSQQYSDNHDGCYRDWLVSKQMDILSKLKNHAKFSAKRKKLSDPIFWSHGTGSDDREVLSSILPPPVPVAIHHPAAWGIRTMTHLSEDDNSNTSTNGSNHSSNINVHHIHPASCTTRIITNTQHRKYQHEHINSSHNSNYNSSSENCSSSASGKANKTRGNNRKSNHLQQTTASTTSIEDNNSNDNNISEDLDDFNLYAQQLHSELQRQEAASYIQLAKLQANLDLHNNALSIAQRRDYIEKILYRAIQCIEPSNAERVVYAFKPTRGHGYYNKTQHTQQGVCKTEHHIAAASTTNTTSGRIFCNKVLKLDLQGNEILPNPKLSTTSMPSTNSQQTARYNTRCVNISDTVLSTLRPHEANNQNFRRDLLGAAAVRQIPNAAALTAVAMPGNSSSSSSHLVVDGEIEVFLQKRWQLATINRVLCDGDLIRHVKVTPEDCTAMESVWVSVEDGRLAPRCTHLRVVKPAPTSVTSTRPEANLPDTPEMMPTNQVGVAKQPQLPAVLLENVVTTAHTSGQRAHIVTPEEPTSLTQASGIAAARLVPAAVSRVGAGGDSRIHNSNNSKNQTERVTVPADRSIVASALLHLNNRSNGQHAPTDPRLQRRSHTLPYEGGQQQVAGTTNATAHSSNVLYPVRGSAFTPPAASTAATATVSQQLAAAQQLWLQQRPSYFPAAPSSSSARVKLPLPLGATNPKDIIPAVSAYTPLTFVPKIPQYNRVHSNNTMNVYGNPNGHNTSPVPYEYEPDSGPELRQPIFDSVGAHSCAGLESRLPSCTLAAAVAASAESSISNNNNRQHQPHASVQGTTITSAAGGGAYNNTATTGTLNGASKIATFRLGPKGSITRN